MAYLAILIGISTALWLLINFATSKTVNWRIGIRYWIACCFTPAMLPFAFGVFHLATFVPPTKFDPSVPDPGPYSFMIAMVLGFIPATVYFLTAVILSMSTASRRAKP